MCGDQRQGGPLPAGLQGIDDGGVLFVEAGEVDRLLQEADAADRPLRQHSCAGTRGTSGAPLLVRDHGRWAAAGVQVAAVEGDIGGLAVPSETVQALLQQ